MTETEALAYCGRGIHVRDTVSGECLECNDVKDPAAEHAELVENEPPRGAVVMTEGPRGTAWQRHNGDGRWHSTTGKSTVWSRLVLSDKPGSRLRVIYLPPPS